MDDLRVLDIVPTPPSAPFTCALLQAPAELLWAGLSPRDPSLRATLSCVQGTRREPGRWGLFLGFLCATCAASATAAWRPLQLPGRRLLSFSCS